MLKRVFLPALLILLFSSIIADAQQGNWGIGLRAGDPTGLTIKKYTPRFAGELSIGRSYYIYPYDYEKGFYRINKYEDHNYYYYNGYRNEVPIALQFHILFSKPMRTAPELSLYGGFGAQFRNRSITYTYRHYYGPGKNDWVYAEDRYNNIDAGLDGVFGLEYTMKDLPLSFFLDGTLFLEIVDDPFILWPQMGLGVRYNFNSLSGNSGNAQPKKTTKTTKKKKS